MFDPRRYSCLVNDRKKLAVPEGTSTEIVFCDSCGSTTVVRRSFESVPYRFSDEVAPFFCCNPLLIVGLVWHHCIIASQVLIVRSDSILSSCLALPGNILIM